MRRRSENHSDVSGGVVSITFGHALYRCLFRKAEEHGLSLSFLFGVTCNDLILFLNKRTAF